MPEPSRSWLCHAFDVGSRRAIGQKYGVPQNKQASIYAESRSLSFLVCEITL